MLETMLLVALLLGFLSGYLLAAGLGVRVRAERTLLIVFCRGAYSRLNDALLKGDAAVREEVKRLLVHLEKIAASK